METIVEYIDTHEVLPDQATEDETYRSYDDS